MKRAAFTLTAILLAAPASALPILPPAPCGCHWEEVTPAQTLTPDPLAPERTWEEYLADLLHEPPYEPPLYELMCFDHLPWDKPGQPKTPDVPSGGGPSGGGGQPGGGSTSVPEPSVLALIAFGGVGVWLRRRA